ncbi:MAG: thioesterase family protein [Bdellovibrionaceae bacterium]|nr:thioesterase family protein [Pseudobdellovibrionaceae bacterium]
MNLFGRCLWLLLRRLFCWKKLDLFGSCDTRFRVNPLDLDLNFHMNNGRYLSLMDLGRFDLMAQAGVFLKLFSKKYYPVVMSESIHFRKSLGLGQGFVLRTVIDSWEGKDFYIRQTFLVGNEVYAEGFIKGRFKQRGRRGSVPVSEIFAQIGDQRPGKPLSDLARAQVAVEDLLAQ